MNVPLLPGSIDTAVVWFRRDLRVEDNPALTAALQAARNVIPLYIWAPEEEGQFQPGRCSRWWTKQSLGILQKELQELGSRLVIRRADNSGRALMQLVEETGAGALFFNHLYDPISLVRDHEAVQALAAQGVLHKSYNADLLYEPWEIVDAHDEPFTCFDDFWGRVTSMPYEPPMPLPAPTELPSVRPSLPSLTLDEVDFFQTKQQEASSEQLRFKWKPGVDGAKQKLESFLSTRLQVFEHDRAKVDREATSQLSPWVHSGTISVRHMYRRVREKQAEWLAEGKDLSRSCSDFLQQMGYREYSRYLSFHFPFLHERALLAHLRACPWRIDQGAFKAWKQGLTGYPLVDAAMKQLWSTGWVHNRLRVVVSSFMVKNLLLPWQWGLKHFWDALLDADLECDALGWQYVAGCMADARPFSYMLDLEKESMRFDPDGEFVRRWLPVLARLPTEYIHRPWDAPDEVLEMAEIELGFNYPHRIIDPKDSEQHVQRACSIMDLCVMQTSVKAPFRPATDPSLSTHFMQAASGTLASGQPASAAKGLPDRHAPQRSDEALEGVDEEQDQDQEEEEEEEEEPGQQEEGSPLAQELGVHGARMETECPEEAPAASQDDSGDDSEGMSGVSEEVVSNVCRTTSSSMPSAWSALPSSQRHYEHERLHAVPSVSGTPSGATVPTVPASMVTQRCSDDDVGLNKDSKGHHSSGKSSGMSMQLQLDRQGYGAPFSGNSGQEQQQKLQLLQQQQQQQGFRRPAPPSKRPRLDPPDSAMGSS